nr:hypothetical protein [Pedobacter sp. ASV19]
MSSHSSSIFKEWIALPAEGVRETGRVENRHGADKVEKFKGVDSGEREIRKFKFNSDDYNISQQQMQ